MEVKRIISASPLSEADRKEITTKYKQVAKERLTAIFGDEVFKHQLYFQFSYQLRQAQKGETEGRDAMA
eukprot:gene11285-17454_t